MKTTDNRSEIKLAYASPFEQGKNIRQYLIQNNALKDLCIKTLGIFSFYSATKKR